MGVYWTLYPSEHSWQSILTLEGPSIVTARAPGPALVLLMMNSDCWPRDKTEEERVEVGFGQGWSRILPAGGLSIG